MPEYYIGLISGTSIDAIDAVLIGMKGDDNPEIISSLASPIEESIRVPLLALIKQGGDATLERLSTLDVMLGRLFAGTVQQLLKQAGLNGSQIRAIGSHGQTVFHQPGGETPTSIQIGDPNLIAEITGITTVADFRRRDMAAGGQGAPMVPAFHRAVFYSDSEDRVVVNIGGIANITILPKDGNRPVSGFDTGPGNTLMDLWTLKFLNQTMDRDGQFAGRGMVNNELLEQLLADSYFSRPAPKSTGREYFNLKWLLKNFGPAKTKPEDTQATLCELTAISIMQAIKESAPDTQRILVCGGGAHNPLLMSRMRELGGGIIIDDTSIAGIGPDWVEAVAFAWLARNTLQGRAGNIPTVTGARSEVVLGGIYPAGHC